MLGIFKNGVIDPPRELHSPAAGPTSATWSCVRSKTPDDTLKDFLASNPRNGFSVKFVDKAVLFAGLDDVYCTFMGELNNLCQLNKQYGLTKCGNEALFVIEAYRTLRDRSPMPAHQVLKDLQGTFAFVIYDHKYATVFAALGADKALNLFWGISADGSVMISDNVALVKASCRKSFAPFPPGCMYHSDRGLISFEHPMHKMKAMPRIDSEGAMCGSYFAVDAYSKVNSMPRVGSSANWATWG
ncbi:aluminum induced protein with YGL and LRDR motifs [Perilla frutescens var. hirtella]|uniref:Aluminum induced protein with YGL and LRDR motifs n=1 Tax=Perilla frutescens var. hirtella TaxID=608512 RepID=A0AAD4P7F9_PERFH|nr:aluminum induced protein with YGL and LRDR motifs [Perilla frutescens var. hirtella]